MCDEVFALYLLTIKDLTNPEFFKKMVKFVFLYWEHLNNMKKITDSSADYSSTHNAEDAPDVSNEFITEFLDCENNTFDFDKNTAIELTQNFCQWMYDSNYTCSKLTLINTNN